MREWSYRVGWDVFNKIGLSRDTANLLKPKAFVEVQGVQADST